MLLKFIVTICCIACSLNAEITLNSKSISYDPSNGVITAFGDVIITQTTDTFSTRELHCEKVSYNEKTKEIKLIGEAVIKEPTGDIISAKNIELDLEFKSAIARALVLILKDSSKIKAQKGTKKNEIFTFENTTYSPCKEINCKLPLWDLAADKVIFDRKEKKFIYKNVRLRIKGVPIFFTPYFSHPSPDVKRKTGFLTPILRHYSDKGNLAGFPFYVALDSDKALKFMPFINTKRRQLASGEYKQKFAKGDFYVSTSVLTKSKSKKINVVDKHTKWHVDSSFCSYNFDKKHLIVQLSRSSDVTYKTAYPVVRHHSDFLLGEKYNDSKVVFDVYDRDYFLTTESHLYQTADKKTVPTVLPHINFNCVRGDFTFDNDIIYLTRKKEKSVMFAKDFFRSTNKVNWNKSIELSPVLFELNSGFRTDFYSVSKAQKTDKSKDRIFPILENQINASVPFMSRIKSTNQTMIWGPKVTVTSIETSKKRANFERNEDSIFDNYSDLNLYAINRFGGYDAIENGERTSAGFENSIYNSERRWLNAFIGRSNNIGNRQKMKYDGRNAMVGRLVLKPIESVSFRMRFVGMPFSEKMRLFESGTSISYKNIFGGIGYYYEAKKTNIKEGSPVPKEGLSQIGMNCGIKLTEFWSISGSEILNLRRKSGKRSLARGITAVYKDECFEFGIGVYRTNFKDKDIKPNTGIALTITFKNLGSLAKSRSWHRYNTEIGTVA